MDTHSTKVGTVGSGFEVAPTSDLQGIRLEGYDGAVGFVDEKERICYMPTIESVRGTLAASGVADKDFRRIIRAYTEVGAGFEQRGYERRHIINA